MKLKVLYILVALSAVTAGYLLSTQHYSAAVPPSAPPPVSLPVPAVAATTHSSDLVGSYRPDFKLGSQTGAFVTPEDFAGKTLLINFWATWCAPCREEMPMLTELQSLYGEAGLQVVGIALDDVQKVRDFVQAFGISYPILVGATDVMEANHNYGNISGALPYSVLVDSDGIIRWQFIGALQHDELVEILKQWL